ncbi:MAG TPA: DUF1579 domain-containing protein [Opitutus sp.]|nr:DUF1579 domain-containing protein [Opitutus sp.]
METATTTPTASPTAEDCPMFAKPQEQHQWLQQLVGEWSFESNCVTGPGEPDQKHRGTETVKTLGDLWIVGESRGEMPGGGTANMMITLGFDPKKNRFVGTWLGSMMTHLWVYQGELDASGRVLTLNAEGPSFTDPDKLAKYQDIIEIKSDSHRTLTSRVLGDDGQWTQFMTAHYRRTK